MIELIRTNSMDPDFRALVILLDKDLRIRDGEDHDFYAQFNRVDKINEVVLAFEEGVARGCGAIKPFGEGKVEVKRMFVKEESRGRGIALKILSELEKWAAETGAESCVLETGKKQPEAISLYQKAGYRFIPNYGQYEGVENSVCMMKSLI